MINQPSFNSNEGPRLGSQEGSAWVPWVPHHQGDIDAAIESPQSWILDGHLWKVSSFLFSMSGGDEVGKNIMGDLI